MDIRDVMTADPVVCSSDSSLKEAARAMRDRNIGDVIVNDDGGRPCGIVTDRDLVIRGLANDGDIDSLKLADVCDGELHSVQIDTNVSDVVALMQERALRRVPVMENDRLVGIVSLGDLAERLDSDSALGKISGAAPDR
jgi:CBS domain-containing protein